MMMAHLHMEENNRTNMESEKASRYHEESKREIKTASAQVQNQIFNRKKYIFKSYFCSAAKSIFYLSPKTKYFCFYLSFSVTSPKRQMRVCMGALFAHNH